MKKLVLIFLSFSVMPSHGQVAKWETQLTALPKDTARVNLLNRIALNTFNSAPEKTKVYAEEARELATTLDYKKGLGESFFNQSLVYRLRGQNSRQLETLLKALSFFESIHDSANIAKTITEIGIAHHEQHDKEGAVKFYQKALVLYRTLKNKKGEAIALRRLGVLESEANRNEQALELYKETLKLHQKLNDQEGVANVLNNMGMCYYDMGDYQRALEYYSASLNVIQEIQNLVRLPAAYHNISRVYLSQGKLKDALEAAKLGLPVAKTTGNRNAMVESTKLHADIYFRLKDYPKAYDFLLQHLQLKDSVTTSQNVIHFAKIKSLMETEQRQQEIALLKQEHSLQQLQKTMAMGGVGMVLLTGMLIIFRQRKSMRQKNESIERDRKLFEAEQAIVKAALENKKLKSKEMELDLEFRHKQLLNYTLNLAQKNALIENLRSGITELIDTTDKESKLKMSRLIKLIDHASETEKDWDEFKMYFEKVHQSFFARLKERFPDLSAGDLRLCALISLNLSIKEMAELLAISAESVKMARHRLRKKLNLTTEENLSEFIAIFKTH